MKELCFCDIDTGGVGEEGGRREEEGGRREGGGKEEGGRRGGQIDNTAFPGLYIQRDRETDTL